MRQRVLARLLTVLCALHLCAAAAFAQFDSATVLGFISDQTGAAMPGATVTLTNPATGISTTAVSDERGQYQFLNVRIGTYSLKAELQGFTTAIAENFTVAVNARQRVDLALSVGGVGETVQVTGAARSARKRIERPRHGHQPRADRQPAAQRACLRRPGVAEPRRAEVVDLDIA